MGIETIVPVLGAAASAMGIGEERRNRKQLEQQEKLQNLQIKGNKELADYEQELAYDMWQKTNYKAQKEQLEKAGLNPALIYGMGGGGGATTDGGSVGSASGGTASDTASMQNAATGMGMMIAQMRVLESQADKNEAEAENLRGADRDNTLADTQNKITENEKLRIEREMAGVQLKIAKATQPDEIKRIQEEAIGKELENILTKSKISINEAELNAISERIAQSWEQLEQGDEKIAIDKFRAEVEAGYKLPDAIFKGMGAVGNLLEQIFRMTKFKTIEIFKKRGKK